VAIPPANRTPGVKNRRGHRLPRQKHVVTVTYLEMRSASALKPRPCADPRFRIEEVSVPQWRFNRFLYDLVGNEWQWTDKTAWSDQQWREYVESPRLRTFAAFYNGSVAGYYELREDEVGGIEIAIFGLTPQFIGKGFGGALLTHALETAWSMRPTRVWLHTCTRDHPAAIGNYRARGMKVFKVERSPGP